MKKYMVRYVAVSGLALIVAVGGSSVSNANPVSINSELRAQQNSSRLWASGSERSATYGQTFTLDTDVFLEHFILRSSGT